MGFVLSLFLPSCSRHGLQSLVTGHDVRSKSVLVIVSLPLLSR